MDRGEFLTPDELRQFGATLLQHTSRSTTAAHYPTKPARLKPTR